MKPRWLMLFGLLLLSITLLACSLASSATPTAPTGGEQPIGITATVEATMPPIAPSTEAIPTRQPPTTTPVAAASATPTATATLTPTATLPVATPKPVSTGPLDFKVNIIGCRLDPTRGGGVVLTMRIDATGGNGVYTYFRENEKVQRTFERPATKGTAVIDAFRVESGDGQKVERKERFTGSQFGCP